MNTPDEQISPEEAAKLATRLVRRIEKCEGDGDKLSQLKHDLAHARDRLSDALFNQHGEDWVDESPQYDDLFAKIARAVQQGNGRTR